MQAFLDALKWVVLWFFVLYGILVSASNLYVESKKPMNPVIFDWRHRLVTAVVFIVCLLVMVKLVV